MTTPRAVIVGAGIGGLTTAALLLRAGYGVVVLEAHIYPGGSAGTFYHKGYRFDAGATLAGGFSAGGPHARVAESLGLEWPISPVDPAWVVHLPDGRAVTQWADPAAWQAERQRAFPASEPFWRRQERLADIAWDISSRPFPWPPRSPADLLTLGLALRPATLGALPYLHSTVADLVHDGDPLLRLFLDAQLLISAQTTAAHAGALYGSAALDLPRRGVNHVHGGIGALASTLVAWIRANGGEVHYRQHVERIEAGRGRPAVVHTRRGLSLTADVVVANVTPWALRDLLGSDAPPALRNDVARLRPTWGAFTLYLGLDAAALSPGLPADRERAPAGMRAMTLSTHTDVAAWWELRQGPDESAYLARREAYAERLIAAAERAIPGLRGAIRLQLTGTPVTFQFYTRRPLGMVGGFAQMSIFAARGPQTGLDNLWLVGDSVFPGQSTAGVTLGAMRVAADIVRATPRLTARPRNATLSTRSASAQESTSG